METSGQDTEEEDAQEPARKRHRGSVPPITATMPPMNKASVNIELVPTIHMDPRMNASRVTSQAPPPIISTPLPEVPTSIPPVAMEPPLDLPALSSPPLLSTPTPIHRPIFPPETYTVLEGRLNAGVGAPAVPPGPLSAPHVQDMKSTLSKLIQEQEAIITKLLSAQQAQSLALLQDRKCLPCDPSLDASLDMGAVDVSPSTPLMSGVMQMFGW